MRYKRGTNEKKRTTATSLLERAPTKHYTETAWQQAYHKSALRTARQARTPRTHSRDALRIRTRKTRFRSRTTEPSLSFWLTRNPWHSNASAPDWCANSWKTRCCAADPGQHAFQADGPEHAVRLFTSPGAALAPCWHNARVSAI